MQYIILGIFSIPFLYINYKIIISDLKEKIIPNKYLLYLLGIIPFFYIFLFFYSPGINYLFFFFSILITIFISFILYYFGIWSAGDAKYLLVLGFFIPNVGIINFIGNIALLTILYLFIYFLWFYFGRCLFNWNYTKSLYKNIYNDFKEKYIYYLKNNGGKINKNKIFNLFLLFLFIFVSIRFIRLIFMNFILKNYLEYITFVKDYFIYLLIIFIIILFILFFTIKFIINKIKELITKKMKIHNSNINLILLSILNILLISFIFREFVKNPYEIKEFLYKLFTIMLIIYIMFKILKYSYKIAFQVSEMYFINIKDLNKGSIIDKKYLIDLFGKQNSIGHDSKTGLLSPDPIEYFNNIENPIDEETKNILVKVYEIVNKYHIENTPNFIENNQIKILKTFAFGGYIFLGFLVSYLFGNSIFSFLFNLFLSIIKQSN